jgi:hypothetical protein
LTSTETGSQPSAVHGSASTAVRHTVTATNTSVSASGPWMLTMPRNTGVAACSGPAASWSAERSTRLASLVNPPTAQNASTTA